MIGRTGRFAPRALLALLELQRQTGLTIKALGDRGQAQSVEAGDTIEIMRRVLSRADMPELLSTVRQVGHTARQTRRLREIAGLFRGNEPDPGGEAGSHLRQVAAVVKPAQLHQAVVVDLARHCPFCTP